MAVASSRRHGTVKAGGTLGIRRTAGGRMDCLRPDAGSAWPSRRTSATSSSTSAFNRAISAASVARRALASIAHSSVSVMVTSPGSPSAVRRSPVVGCSGPYHSRMDPLTLYGLVAVSLMLLFYALEHRSSVFVLAFAAACVMASVYGFLQGAGHSAWWRLFGPLSPCGAGGKSAGRHRLCTLAW